MGINCLQTHRPWLGLVVMCFGASCATDAPEPSGTSTGARLVSHYKPRTRTYFVAADELAWDYAPSGKNLITDEPFDEAANVFVGPGDDRIGRVYKKALYREYTDATFEKIKPIPPAWQHLGTLGPLIRGVVGDEIHVVFRNHGSHAYSIHAHGVFYDKASEGAPYADGTTGKNKADESVAPGATYKYVWKVPERAGPAAHDGSTAFWMYHSHVDEVADTNAGLIGPIVITAAAHAKDDATAMDVDREFVTMFTVFDENASHLLQDNIDTYAGKPGKVDTADEEFIESNLMHSINGFVFGNLPGLKMNKGEKVRWYLMGMGTEVDLHTPHWHGHVATIAGMHTDVATLLPATMMVADMVADNPGEWLYHCHVNDHITAGMIAKFNVKP